MKTVIRNFINIKMKKFLLFIFIFHAFGLQF